MKEKVQIKILRTGDIEIAVASCHIINPAKPLPFSKDDNAGDSDTRLKYRFLDIRERLISNLEIRAQTLDIIRTFLIKHKFLEVNTPLLCKSTPGGAKEFLVPFKEELFFALPQSPQIFKQLLMVAGIERYFQIAPCFRHEDLRKDRQLEFYQVDIEVSFESRSYLFDIIEKCYSKFSLA